MGGAAFITIYPPEVTRTEPPQRKHQRGDRVILTSRPFYARREVGFRFRFGSVEPLLEFRMALNVGGCGGPWNTGEMRAPYARDAQGDSLEELNLGCRVKYQRAPLFLFHGKRQNLAISFPYVTGGRH